MSSQQEPLNILAPHSFREKLSRRALFQMGAAASGLAIVAAACGSSKKAASNTAASGTTASGGTTAPGGTAAPALSTGGFGDTGLGPASGTWSRTVNKSSGSLNMYTWGAYNDPDIVGALAEKDLAIKMKVDYYTSNEDLITKLQASKGTTGFDIVVPTGPYIPQMIQNGLLEKFDKTKLPNMVNVDPNYLAQAWDPTNDYSVCKDWGSTGWIYNKTKIKSEIKTWTDFIAVCQGEGSKNCAVLDTPANIAGWALGGHIAAQATFAPHSRQVPACAPSPLIPAGATAPRGREIPRSRDAATSTRPGTSPAPDPPNRVRSTGRSRAPARP